MDFKGIRVVLLDIEGTVCPISFVKDVLFPYALQSLAATVKAQWDDESFKPYRDAYPVEYRATPEDLEAHTRDLMAKDVKVSYMKKLQGYLWQSGYASGNLKCPLFSDVAPAMHLWREQSRSLMIYSSGSVAAQKLLFQYTDTEPADLRPLLDDYFDTVNAGLKQEVKSYERILRAHPEHDSSRWLFLSDNAQEVNAALGAGMQSALVVRPGNSPVDFSALKVVESFADINMI